MVDSVELKRALLRKKGEAVTVDEALRRQVASLIVLKKSTNEISKELDISFPLAKRLMHTDEVKAIVKEIGESAVAGARSLMRRELASIATEIAEVLTQLIREGNMDAIKTGLKVLGCLEEEVGATQATQLTVVLPGSSSKKEKEVISDSVQDGSN